MLPQEEGKFKSPPTIPLTRSFPMIGSGVYRFLLISLPLFDALLSCNLWVICRGQVRTTSL